ncbi:GGDEF domain-containing protein [Vibrio sonorensis]|uniref:GGDEF domain-containing protein n=1 Tax=Vibrio sonorensis TaxID=1004316 RepID=UPI0008DA8883|nr:GGDEF domain-containing protein [Vibrio sonorensis]
MEVIKEAFLLELESYIKVGDSSNLNRLVEVSCIESEEDAERVLGIISPSSTKEQLSRGSMFLYLLSRDQYAQKYIDTLTGFHTFNYLKYIADKIRLTQFQLFFFDLDNMKSINDNLGHDQGNRLIQYFSIALKNSFRNTDSLIRYGGDEFVVIAHRGNLKDSEVERRIHQAISELKCPFPISFSFGSAHNTDKCLMKALKKADESMYQMKNLKRLSLC